MATNGPQRQLGSSEDWWNRFRRIEQDATRAPMVFIVGSALSTAGGHGVPGIVETVDLILEKYPGRGLDVTGAPPTKRYQGAFGQLPIKVHADAPDEVVRECVLRASSLPSGDARLEKVRKRTRGSQCEACAELQHLDDWWLPPGVMFLANMVRRARERRKAGGLTPAAPLIITTNFDGLIEVALRKLGVPAVAKNLPRDDYARSDPGVVCVWHVHGYWCSQPTLHTPGQLNLERPKLERALGQAFDGASIRVLAYGGWNDRVFDVLAQVLKDGTFTEAPEVLWAFYQRTEPDVTKENAHVFDAFRTDGGMSRAVFFAGVDAHQAPEDLMPERSGVTPSPPAGGAGRKTHAADRPKRPGTAEHRESVAGAASPPARAAPPHEGSCKSSSLPVSDVGAWDKPRLILHLSDLHFGTPKSKGHYWNSEGRRHGLAPKDQPDLLRCLVRDLKSVEVAEQAPDIVVVSGDLLDRGDGSGVVLATEFLKGLSKQLGLDRRRFVLAPGNHDVDRAADEEHRLRHFDDLRNEFYGTRRRKVKRGVAPSERCDAFDYPELGLEFVAFNTCENLGDGNEHGSLGETQRCAAEPKLESSGTRIRIAVMHHHLRVPPGVVRSDYSVMDDAPLVEEWLAAQGFALVLHGHQHVDWLGRGGTGTRDFLITAAGSLGVGAYGRSEWSLPLQYQLIVLQSPRHGIRVRREYDEQHRQWGPAGRGAPSEPLSILHRGPVPAHAGEPPPALATIPTPSAGGAARTSVAGSKRFLGPLDQLIAFCPQDRRAAFERYRAQAEHDEDIDLLDFVSDACRVLSARLDRAREFARLASELVFSLAYYLAERVQQARELQKSGLESERYHRLPAVTYLFAEIIIAYADERGRIAARIHKERDNVVGQKAVIWSGADCAARGEDALLALERALWRVLNPTEGEYRPTCQISYEQCEDTKKAGGPCCHEGCHRVKLGGQLRFGAREHNHAHVFVEELSEQEARTMAQRLRHVILVQFSGSSLTFEEREREVELAQGIRRFIDLTQPHLGTP